MQPATKQLAAARAQGQAGQAAEAVERIQQLIDAMAGVLGAEHHTLLPYYEALGDTAGILGDTGARRTALQAALERFDAQQLDDSIRLRLHRKLAAR